MKYDSVVTTDEMKKQYETTRAKPEAGEYTKNPDVLKYFRTKPEELTRDAYYEELKYAMGKLMLEGIDTNESEVANNPQLQQQIITKARDMYPSEINFLHKEAQRLSSGYASQMANGIPLGGGGMMKGGFMQNELNSMFQQPQKQPSNTYNSLVQ